MNNIIRKGKATVLRINAKQMFEDGIKFYLSNNGVWLTDYVSPKYIILYESSPEAIQPHKWKGENLLGFALMEVREILSEKK